MIVLVVDRPDTLSALPGDLDVVLVSGERLVESGSLPVGEVLLPGAEMFRIR